MANIIRVDELHYHVEDHTNDRADGQFDAYPELATNVIRHVHLFIVGLITIVFVHWLTLYICAETDFVFVLLQFDQLVHLLNFLVNNFVGPASCILQIHEVVFLEM
jgi:hypothetical protein